MQQKASGAQQSLQGPWNDDSLADFGVAATAIIKPNREMVSEMVAIASLELVKLHHPNSGVICYRAVTARGTRAIKPHTLRSDFVRGANLARERLMAALRPSNATESLF